MRFVLMIAFLMTFIIADELPQAPKPYEKNDHPKIEIGGEILLRYEKQKTNNDHLKRSSKGSQGSLNLSIE